MGVGVIIAGFISILILIIAAISYFISKKFKYPKIIKAASLILVLIVVIPTIVFIFEEELYFKSDVKNDLKEIDMILYEDFEIKNVRIVGTSDYYQTVELKISKNDRDRLINEIRNSGNYATNKTINEYDFTNQRKPHDLTIINGYDGASYKRLSTKKEEGYSTQVTALKLNPESYISELIVISD